MCKRTLEFIYHVVCLERRPLANSKGNSSVKEKKQCMNVSSLVQNGKLLSEKWKSKSEKWKIQSEK